MKLTKEQIEQVEKAIANGGDITLSFPKPEPERWEPEGGDLFFTKDNIHNALSSKSFSKIGGERNSKEEAEIALAGQIRRNLLSAWAAEHGGEQAFVKDEKNWHVFLDDDKCRMMYSTSMYRFETVYMTKEAAEKFCEWYNKGRIDL